MQGETARSLSLPISIENVEGLQQQGLTLVR